MKKPSWGPGCLILFALPFAAVGVITGYQIFSSLWEWAQIQSWDEVPTQKVRHEQLGFQPSGYSIPVRFAIPSRAAPTDESDSDDKILWRLKASASLPGVDYSASFDVPVFATGKSDPSKFREKGCSDDPSNFSALRTLRLCGFA